MKDLYEKYGKKIEIAVGAIAILLGAYTLFQGESRHGLYYENVLPFADRELDLMTISEKAEMTYERYAEIHLAACHLNADLLNQSDDKPYKAFSDQECLEMMEKSRPFALELKYKRNPANQ